MRTRRRKYGEGHLCRRFKSGLYYVYFKSKVTGKVKGVCLGTPDEREAHIKADAKIMKDKEEALLREAINAKLESSPARPFMLSSARPNLTVEQRRQALIERPDLSVQELMALESQFRDDDEATEELVERLEARRTQVDEQTRLLDQLNRENPRLDDMWEKVVKWLQANRRPNTLLAYRSAWKKFRKLVVISRIADLNEAHVGQFIARCQEDGVSDLTIGLYIKQLSNVFTIGIRVTHWKGKNIFRGASHGPKRTKQPSQFITPEQRDQLLALAKTESDHLYLFIALCTHAGLRPTEAVNQRWEEIDFDNKVLHVRAKEVDEAKGIQEFRVKDYESRTVPIRNELLGILMQYRQHEGYVYVDPKRPELKRFNFNASVHTPFRRIRDAAGIRPEITPHDLRHTFGSLLAQAGVSIFKIAEWLGHANVNTTARIYAHLQAYDDDINRDPKNGTVTG